MTVDAHYQDVGADHIESAEPIGPAPYSLGSQQTGLVEGSFKSHGMAENGDYGGLALLCGVAA